ncbi:hypothetical protein ACMHYB_10650 [Sorangium sp. So ce1128]
MSQNPARVIDLEEYRRRRAQRDKSRAAPRMSVVWLPVWGWIPVWS